MKIYFLLVFLALTACGLSPEKQADLSKIGSRPAGIELPPIKTRILALATSEWLYFGQQSVIYDGDKESIPQVGFWEDESPYVQRINQYWRAVGMPDRTGRNCEQPWSAAFVSWVMSTAGVPKDRFPPSEAHWIYLSRIIRSADMPKASFVPRAIKNYKPRPGDLVCASRGSSIIAPPAESSFLEIIENTKLHCDIVVEKHGRTLETIGGNVRNSVSKNILKLDKNGHLQPIARRPWFLVIENRL
ncbi:DUF2272 domain-containing protein [Methylocaldum sp.]|uniref:DUF2272 domain-containing protein n=1 Tax=Methylocaldum sp. TaxID=1969727 RepID=UPI002D4B1F87|nr:DUF2272 domain-containing protein [Methylocaldum sp.]HYE34192.1 DUF2272 domain-containing protein [Methylocaldum sp.]